MTPQPPTLRDLRTFGLGVGLIGAALSALGAWKPEFVVGWGRIAIWSACGALVVLGALAPRALAWPYRVWMAMAEVLGRVMTTLLLTAFFVAILTPIGLLRRLLGKDPLGQRPAPPGGTYWHAPDDDPRGPERYEQPF